MPLTTLDVHLVAEERRCSLTMTRRCALRPCLTRMSLFSRVHVRLRLLSSFVMQKLSGERVGNATSRYLAGKPCLTRLSVCHCSGEANLARRALRAHEHLLGRRSHRKAVVDAQVPAHLVPPAQAHNLIELQDDAICRRSTTLLAACRPCR